MAKPARADIDEFTNPSWQEVPKTETSNVGGDGNVAPAYININNLKINQEVITFDVVDFDAQYRRLDIDCNLYLYRVTRIGIFESDQRVDYSSYSDPWMAVRDDYHKALAEFVCNL